MTMEAGPHIPKKGWLMRWLKQGVQLVARAPQALAIFIATSFAMGVIQLVIAFIVFSIGMTSKAIVPLSVVLTAPLSLFFVGLVMNSLMKADLGEAHPVSEVWRRAMSLGYLAIVIAVVIHTVLFAINFAFGFGLEIEERSGARAPEGAALAGLGYVILMLGVHGTLNSFVVSAIIHPFAVPALLGLGLGRNEVVANDMVLRRKNPQVHQSLFMAVVFGSILCYMLPGPLALASGIIFLAWNYVGGREVVGGIDKNGTPQREAAFKPATSLG